MAEEEIVIARPILKVGESAEFLDAVVAVDGPDAIVLAGWTEDEVVVVAGQLFLLPPDDALEGVHGHEIGIASTGPLVIHYVALPELVFGL